MDSRRLAIQSFSVKNTTNAGLWLHKYIREQKVEKQESTAKQDLVNQVSNIEVPDIYESFFYDIWKPSVEKYAPQSIEISGRMIVGLGAESVLETSITLHRTYGVPYIPGSALKGLAASYAHRFMGDEWKKETKDKTKKIGEAHRLMFGSQDSAGYVIFHDALYVPNSYKNKPKNPLETDILTVHHQKYYQGKDSEGNYPPPADWDNPVPIPLLSAQGKYLLAVSANSGDAKFDEKMTSLAIEILGLALEQEGIGAKTSSGYGRAKVKPFEENIQSVLEALPTEPTQKTVAKVEISAEEKAANKLNLFENMKKKLAEITDYEKISRNKLKDIVKDDLKRLEGELKKQAATLIVKTARDVSQNPKYDGLLEKAEWFVEAKKWL